MEFRWLVVFLSLALLAVARALPSRAQGSVGGLRHLARNGAGMKPLKSNVGGDKLEVGWDRLSDDGVDEEFGSGEGPLPSVSSKINFPEERINIKHDLWVVGAGTLGSLAAKQWKMQFPASRVVAETKSSTRHGELQAAGIDARLRDARVGAETDRSAKHVLVCFPPSIAPSAQDYNGELAEACRIWAGPKGGGRLLYTSSTAVYGESHGNTVTEAFRVDTRTARSTRMINAEEQIVTRGGSIMRLAGLYDAQRGPHSYWLRQGSVEGSAEGTLNMLHYEDAAAICIRALLTDVPGSNIETSIYSNSNRQSLVLENQNIFLAADDTPISRIDVCRAAVASKQFGELPLPTFATATGPPGKVCDDSWTRARLCWRPVHRTFAYFMRKLGGSDEPEPAAKEPPAAKEEPKSLLWLPGDDDEA